MTVVFELYLCMWAYWVVCFNLILLWVYLWQALCKYCWKYKSLKASGPERSEVQCTEAKQLSIIYQFGLALCSCKPALVLAVGVDGKRKEQDVFPPLTLLMFFDWILIALMLREEHRKEVTHHYVTLKQERFISLIMKLVFAASLTECVGLRRLRRRKTSIMVLSTVAFISFSCSWVDSDEMTPRGIQWLLEKSRGAFDPT